MKKERGLRAPGNDDFAEVISKLTVPPNEPVIDKSVDYRAFKRAFQALRNQSLPLDMALIR